MGYCCASKVKMYWALSLPWAVETHELVRDKFIKEQLWASHRVAHFGYPFIEHVYCHSDHVADPEVAPLPLINVSVEVDPSDFEMRLPLHLERAANLSNSLLGTQVEFCPRWGRSAYVTQIISARSERKRDGSVAVDQKTVCVYNNPVALNLTRPSSVARLTRKYAVDLGDRELDVQSLTAWTDMYFDCSVNALTLFSQAQGEASCLPVLGSRLPCVQATIRLSKSTALIPVFAEDLPEAVVDRMKNVQGNLRCLRGGENEVRAFLKARSVPTQRLPKSFRYE